MEQECVLMEVVDVAGWAGPCGALERTYRKLFVDLGNEGVRFVTAMASGIEELAEFESQSQPTVLMFKRGRQFATIRGARAAEVEETVEVYQPKEGDADVEPEYGAPHLSLRQQAEAKQLAEAAKNAPVVVVADEDEEEAKAHAAATKIQAVFRGHKVRTGAEPLDGDALVGSAAGAAVVPGTDSADAGGEDEAEGEAAAVGADAGAAGGENAEPNAEAGEASEANGLSASEARAFLSSAKPMLGLVANDKTKQVLVTDVKAGSPAEAAGIVVGDIIEGVGGKAVKSMKALSASFRFVFPGAVTKFRILRKSEAGRTHVVTKGKRLAMPVVIGAKGLKMPELDEYVAAAGSEWVREQAAIRARG